MSTVDLRAEFIALQPNLRRLQKSVTDQLTHLVEESELTLGVPIESRLKSWDSLDEKLRRKGLTALSSFEDLLGIRIIFLFQRDLEKFVSSIESNFKVHSKEDTSDRLGAEKFGYKSTHYIVSAPKAWTAVPTMTGLDDLKVEVQVRTLSQHIWAAASHKLQYKQEAGVPEPIKRSINRLSALLELVDLELVRVLNDRDVYAAEKASDPKPIDLLDVSLVEAVLDAELPPGNKDHGAEDYGDLLRDLIHFSINTRGELEKLLRTQMPEMQRAERSRSSDFDETDDAEEWERNIARLDRGVYFTHVGLAREALCAKFSEEAVREWQRISEHASENDA